jgi:hypothetical protein
MSGAQDVGPLTQQQIGYYQNPFTQSVVDPTVKAMQQQFGQQNAQQQAQAIKGNAFGTERAGLQQAALRGQQGLAQAQAIAPIYERGYASAADLAKSQQGVVAQDYARRMQAGQQIAGLGTAAQAAALQGSQAQIAAGTLQQQTAQAGNTALYQQHLQEQGYPFQVAQFLANIAEGTGALSGNTSTQNRSGGFFSNRGGFKVNERAARAYGGGLDVNSMGGAVYEPGEYARGGYEGGGDVQMADILAANAAMFQGLGAPYGQGQKPGAGLGIPSQAPKITPLQVKPIQEPQKGANPITTAANAVKDYKTIKEFGSEVKRDWFNKKPDESTGTKGSTEQQTGVKPPAATAPPAAPVETPAAPAPAPAATPTPVNFEVPDTEGAFGDALGRVSDWFNRGGNVPDYACGGLVPRQAAAVGGFRTPGYDPELPGTDIMDSTVESGQQTPGQLKGEQEGMNPKISGGGGGGFGIGDAVGTAMKVLPFFLKDGGFASRDDYAEGGADRRGDSDPMAGLDIDRLEAMLSAGSKASNTAPIRYKTDDGSEFRGQATYSGPFSQYGVGLGTNLGGGRLDLNMARGSAPHSAPQYTGGLKWSKNFADGGVVYREHHDGTEGNVVGERPQYTEDQIRQYATTAAPFLISRESAGDPKARATTSSAAGLGQFTDDTARTVAQRHPEIFQGVEYDPKQKGFTATLPENVQKAMIDAHAMDQARLLVKHGIEPTPQNIHMNWFLGEGGGPNFMKRMKEDPNAPAHTLADRPAVLANQNIFFDKKTGNPRTAQEVYDIMGKGSNAPRPPMDIGRAVKSEEAKGTYGGNSAKTASIGDVVREYAPSGVPTSENFWIPALGFLGGMLTSPNRSLAGAIGSGLVSGASGYMELRKGQQEDIKNAFNVFKERFEDAIDPTTKQPAKRDKFTGQLYAPEQAQSSLAKTLRSIGVDPAAYGVVESKSPMPEKTGTGTTTAGGPLPPPVTGGKPGEKPSEKPAEPAIPGELPKPPANLPKTEMTLQQLRADAFHDWKTNGLSEDPKARLARAKAHRDDAAALSQLGVSAGPRVAEANRLAEAELTNLNKELDAAAERQNSINKENDKLKGISADKYGNQIAGRMESYERRREQLDEVNRMFSQVKGGRALPALAEMNSWLASLGVPVDSKRAADTDYVMKLVMTKMVEDIETDKLMRAPASGMKTLIQTVPNPSMDPGATYTLLGQLMGEMDYVHRRDKAYEEGMSPVAFAKKWEATNTRSINHDVAAGLSKLRLHEGMSPDVVKSLMEKYGQYGYSPQGMREAERPAAPTVAPGQRVGEEKQFKQGVGVWDGSKWVPKGQQ